MPKGLTAVAGMDALTHAVEAYVSTAATPITDACAFKAIDLISTNLRHAVNNGQDMVARENIAYSQFLVSMALNSASLGYVHARLLRSAPWCLQRRTVAARRSLKPDCKRRLSMLAFLQVWKRLEPNAVIFPLWLKTR